MAAPCVGGDGSRIERLSGCAAVTGGTGATGGRRARQGSPRRSDAAAGRGGTMTGRGVWIAITIAVGVAACSNAVTSRKPWDDYAGETLKVHGADPATAGQVAWLSPPDQDNPRPVLASHREPHTLEIRRGRFAQQTVILAYKRRSARESRRSAGPSDACAAVR